MSSEDTDKASRRGERSVENSWSDIFNNGGGKRPVVYGKAHILNTGLAKHILMKFTTTTYFTNRS